MRLVASQSAPRPRLVEVRLTAIAGHPYRGETHTFQLSYQGLLRLIAFAERLEECSA